MDKPLILRAPHAKLWLQFLGLIDTLEWFIPGIGPVYAIFSGSCRHIDLQLWMIQQCLSHFPKNATSALFGGFRRGDGHWEFPSRDPGFSSPVHRCVGWGTYLQVIIAAGVWFQELKELHIYVLQMRMVQLVVNAFFPWVMGECHSGE